MNFWIAFFCFSPTFFSTLVASPLCFLIIFWKAFSFVAFSFVFFLPSFFVLLRPFLTASLIFFCVDLSAERGTIIAALKKSAIVYRRSTFLMTAVCYSVRHLAFVDLAY